MAGIPAEKAVELFNRAVDLDFGDFALARELHAEAKVLERNGIANAMLKAVLARAALVLGRREEAVDALIATSYFPIADLPVVNNICQLYTFVGQRRRLLDLANKVWFSSGYLANSAYANNATLVALWAGDVGMLRRIAEVEEQVGLTGSAARKIALLAAAGLLEHFEGFQIALIESLSDCQVEAVTYDVDSGEEDSMILTQVLIDPGKKRREEAEQAVEAAVSCYFAAKGLAYADFDLRIGYLIGEAPRPPTVVTFNPRAA